MVTLYDALWMQNESTVRSISLLCFFTFMSVLDAGAHGGIHTHQDHQLHLPPSWHLVASENVRFINFYEEIPVEDQVDNQKTRVWHFHRDSIGQSALWRAGDLRLLCFGIDSLSNQSRSASHGWNYGAYPYFHQNDFHLVGGYGFWRKHADDIVFLPTIQEWERVGDSRGMEFENPSDRDWFFRLADGSIGCLQWQSTAESPHQGGTIWSMPAGGGEWSLLYEAVAPSGAAMIRKLYEFKDWLLIGYTNRAVSLVRKSDWAIHTRLTYPEFEILQSSNPTAIAVYEEHLEAWKGDSLISTFSIQDFLARSSVDGWSTFVKTPESKSNSTADPQAKIERSVFFILLGILMLSVIWISYAKRSLKQPVIAGRSEDIEPTDEIILELLRTNLEYISIPEFDQWIIGADHLSPETVRSKRAQLFREINQEAKRRFGHDMLHRERTKNDSRILRYKVIKPK